MGSRIHDSYLIQLLESFLWVSHKYSQIIFILDLSDLIRFYLTPFYTFRLIIRQVLKSGHYLARILIFIGNSNLILTCFSSYYYNYIEKI